MCGVFCPLTEMFCPLTETPGLGRPTTSRIKVGNRDQAVHCKGTGIVDFQLANTMLLCRLIVPIVVNWMAQGYEFQMLLGGSLGGGGVH